MTTLADEVRQIRDAQRRQQQQLDGLVKRLCGSRAFVGNGQSSLAGIVFKCLGVDDAEDFPQLVVDYSDGDAGTAELQFVAPSGTTTPITPTRFAPPETPGGTIGSDNVTFTLAATPDPTTSVVLVTNGIVQRNIAASGTDVGDYALSGLTITYEVAPVSGDWHLAWYRY